MDTSKPLPLDFGPLSPITDLAGVLAQEMKAEKKLLNDFLTSYSEVQESTNNSFKLTEGTLSVLDNGNDNYTVTMDLKLEGGKTFKGTYTGDFIVLFSNS